MIPRNTDSEYKILDNVPDLLGSNTSARGTIKIVTERPACDLEVKIFDNTGVVLKPKKP